MLGFPQPLSQKIAIHSISSEIFIIILTAFSIFAAEANTESSDKEN